MRKYKKRNKHSVSASRSVQWDRLGYTGLKEKPQQADIRRILRATGVQAPLTQGQSRDKSEKKAEGATDLAEAMHDSVPQNQFENKRNNIESIGDKLEIDLCSNNQVYRALDLDNDFDDCDRKGGVTERTQIEKAHDEAINRLRQKVQLLISDPESQTFWLKNIFNIGDLDKPKERKKLDSLIYKLNHTRIGLQKKSFNYECDYQDDLNIMCREGDVAAVGIATDIHICPLFFKKSPNDQVNTIIHESLHKFGGADDTGKNINNAYALAAFVMTDKPKSFKKP